MEDKHSSGQTILQADFWGISRDEAI